MLGFKLPKESFMPKSAHWNIITRVYTHTSADSFIFCLNWLMNVSPPFGENFNKQINLLLNYLNCALKQID